MAQDRVKMMTKQSCLSRGGTSCVLAEHLDYYAEAGREGLYKALFLAIVSEKEMAVSSALYKVAGIPLNTANHFPQPSMFTDEDVAKMIKMREEGMTSLEIAEVYGCSKSTINRRLQGRGGQA